MPRRYIVQVLDFVPKSMRTMEMFLLRRARMLRERDWISIHVFSGELGQEFETGLRAVDSLWHVERFPINATTAWSIGGRFRKFSPEILETAFMSKFSAALPILKWRLGARVLLVADHSSGAVLSRPWHREQLSRVRGVLMGRLIDRVFPVSEFVRRRDVERVYLPASKMRVILNGVDESLFASAPHVPGDIPIIAFAGQLIPEKGVGLLLAAVSILLQSGNKLKLLIAGAGYQEQELKRWVVENKLVDSIEFLGQIDWIHRLFSSVDIVVAPSEWEEACALSIIEAMASGACVVASDAGGNPELVGLDGGAGVIFRRGDSADLARCLGELLNNPARRLAIGANARARAAKHFNLQRMVEDYLRVYDELVDPPLQVIE